MTLAELIQHVLNGELSKDLLTRALIEAGSEYVYKGERWFALPNGDGPMFGHIPFWLPRSEASTLVTQQDSDNAKDEVLSIRYGVRLARDIEVTIGIPSEFGCESESAEDDDFA